MHLETPACHLATAIVDRMIETAESGDLDADGKTIASDLADDAVTRRLDRERPRETEALARMERAAADLADLYPDFETSDESYDAMTAQFIAAGKIADHIFHEILDQPIDDPDDEE